MAGALPNLVVIGAMKAGTTALHSYLDLHPEVAMSRPKELDFFVDGRIEPGPGCTFDDEDLRIERTFDTNWSRGVEWYARHFDPRAPVRGEASPSYSAPWYPDVAERMASMIPDAKLVFVARDPVERAISNYAHQRMLGRERRDIDEALANLGGPYVVRSLYSRALAPFYERFGRERILVITAEELRDRRRETVQGVYRFIGVDGAFWSTAAERERYGSEGRVARGPLARAAERTPLRRLARRLPDGAKSRIERLLASRHAAPQDALSQPVRAALHARLAEDVPRLGELTGRDYSAYWGTAR